MLPVPAYKWNSNNVTNPLASAGEIWLTVFDLVVGVLAWDHVGRTWQYKWQIAASGYPQLSDIPVLYPFGSRFCSPVSAQD